VDASGFKGVVMTLSDVVTNCGTGIHEAADILLTPLADSL
jgi:hypothetical protein